MACTPLLSSRFRCTAGAALASLLVAACGGGGGGGYAFMPPASAPAPAPPSAPARGDLEGKPTSTGTLTAAQFDAALKATDTGKGLALVAGTPQCGVATSSITYHTIGGAGEPTTATAAVMVPTGSGATCTGKRPLVLYAHGTTTARNYDLAKWTNPTQAAASEGTVVAATLAAQGFVVVAPNYAGYDASPLPYHPYLNADQQGKDMADALSAARKALPLDGASDSGALLITGYSQGGFVAMAAHRELQAQGQTVTASAPLSAPTAISLLMEYSFSGWPPLGGTIFLPMITTSWQKQFGNVYQSPSEIYENAYANGIESLLPSTTPIADIFASGKLPQTAMYPAGATPGPVSPALSIFYGANNLIRQSYLTQVANDIASAPCPGNALPPTAASLGSATPLACAPATGLRRAAVANDLRNWTPKRPVFMCGGANDPTVNFVSTRATMGYFAAQGVAPAQLALLDLEEPSGSGDPFAAARAGFAQAKANLYAATAGDDAAKTQAVTLAYHGSLVPPFCLASARGFFAGVLASGG